MLKPEEILELIQLDNASDVKGHARKGQEYYEGRHDILNYRLFYYNSEGQLTEDKFRSNIRIPHPFFTELVDQAVQYVLSGDDFIKSDKPELQKHLDIYFNQNEDFTAELSEAITGCMAKGYDFMYAYKDENDRLAFQCANCLGVVEVRAKDTSDKCDYVIYRYTDRIEKGKKKINRIQVWDNKQVYYYVQEEDSGKIMLDEDEPINPKPHVIYTKEGDPNTYFEGFGFIPFFRLDNNKKRVSNLATVKSLIDDYDLMASSLSNNLVDFDTPIHVVSGFQGDNLDQLQTNLKTKKLIGVDEDGGMEIKTVDVPYQARKEKLELDEKNIYRFGFGLNISGLKDTAATTNIAIKAAYSLLDLRATKFEIKLKQFLRKILKVVIDEINTVNGTDYQQTDVYFNFEHEIMSNETENAQIRLTEAQAQQTAINTLLGLTTYIGDEVLMQQVCDVLELDYEELKSKFPDPNEPMNNIEGAEGNLEGAVVVE